MKFGFSMIATLGALGALAAGCPSEPDYPVQPSASYTPPPPPPTSSAPPPAAVTPCDALQSASLAQAFAARAVSEAAGMKPQGNPVCGNVPEGGSVSSEPFYLDASVCYTAIANGLPNVTEVDVSIVIDPTALGIQPALAQIAAQALATDSDVGAMARINCYKYAMLIAAPAKMVVKARQGAGVVGGQLFIKKT